MTHYCCICKAAPTMYVTHKGKEYCMKHLPEEWLELLPSYRNLQESTDISLCSHCGCMTKIIKTCGKCGGKK